MEPTKVCSKCGTEKPLSDFYFRKDANAHRKTCKVCCLKSRVLTRDEHNAHRRMRYQENPEKFKKAARDWQSKNKERKKENDRDWRIKNRKRANETKRAWRKRGGEAYRRARIARNFRRRIRLALRGICKSASSIALLGCSIEFLRKYLENQFLPGMSWDNYGIRGWHIDHKLACANFDLSVPEQQFQCFNYTNLQPLWAIDNIKKGAKDA